MAAIATILNVQKDFQYTSFLFALNNNTQKNG